jgi:dihydroneopterin aldolase/D-erythro-7,8-dihydroneopterin triphosphate epimerase
MRKHPDIIHIRDLTVSCIVGTRPAERTRRRRVVLNLSLQCDLRRAGETDDLRHTVDYGAVCRRVAGVVRRSRCRLIEALAQRVAETCLAFPGVLGARVTLDKPGCVRGARSVAVESVRLKLET